MLEEGGGQPRSNRRTSVRPGAWRCWQGQVQLATATQGQNQDVVGRQASIRRTPVDGALLNLRDGGIHAVNASRTALGPWHLPTKLATVQICK